MEESLCDAAMRGDLELLLDIIARDKYILDRVVVGIFKGKNPLHVAISTGQTKFVQNLLEIKPNLANVLDAELGAALHIASAKGHLDIVKALVKVSPEMCLARDRDGNNPLHVAAMKGHVQVIKELVRTSSVEAQVKVDRGDTILHLCVKYYQFRCLELLLKVIPNPNFVNDTDKSGNTILHLAVHENQLEIIEHVLGNTKIAVNATNKCGQTALDINSHLVPKNPTDKEDVRVKIREILLNAGAVGREKDTVKDELLEPSWQTKRRNTFMIVSSLIATMSYQVGVNPPGGVWLDDSAGHKVGKAILGYNYPDLYPIFMCFNTIGFLLSLTTIQLLIITLPERGWVFRGIQAVISWCTIMTTAFAYLFSVITISPGDKYERGASRAIKITAMLWAAIMCLLFGIQARQMKIDFCNERRFRVFQGHHRWPESNPTSVRGNESNV